MGCITEVSTVHEVKGRIRFRIPQIRWSPNNSAELKKVLRNLPGIYHFKVCVHTGTTVIYYNRRTLSRETLEETIHHCPFPESEDQKPKTPPPVHIKERERTLETGFFQHDHLFWFDLLKHGIMAGGGNNAIGGHLPLAIVAMIGWRFLKRKMHTKKPRRGQNGKKLASSK